MLPSKTSSSTTITNSHSNNHSHSHSHCNFCHKLGQAPTCLRSINRDKSWTKILWWARTRWLRISMNRCKYQLSFLTTMVTVSRAMWLSSNLTCLWRTLIWMVQTGRVANNRHHGTLSKCQTTASRHFRRLKPNASRNNNGHSSLIIIISMTSRTDNAALLAPTKSQVIW